MKQCKKCQLAFESLNPEGLCETCAPVAARDSEVDALKAQLQQSDQRFQMLASSVQQQNRPAQPSQEEQQRALNQQAWANPAQFTQAVAQHAAQQAVGAALSNDHDTIVGVAISQAREGTDEEMRKYFDKYLPEIKQRMNEYGIQYHRNSNVWRNMAASVIGAHVREIMHDQREAEQQASGKQKAPAVRTQDGPAAPSTRPAQGGSREEPLPEEAVKIAKRLGITETQMRQGIKDFESQSDDPNTPSSWDRVVSSDNNTGHVARRKAQEAAARRVA